MKVKNGILPNGFYKQNVVIRDPAVFFRVVTKTRSYAVYPVYTVYGIFHIKEERKKLYLTDRWDLLKPLQSGIIITGNNFSDANTPIFSSVVGNEETSFTTIVE